MSTNTIPTAAEFDLSELDDNYGDAVTIYANDDEESSWRILVEIDYDPCANVLDDGDWYGELQWVDERDGHHQRPDHFDGRARIINFNRGERMWWQPPTDLPDNDALREMQSSIRNLLEFGYSYVGVQVQELTPNRVGASWVTLQIGSLHGVDLANGTYAEIWERVREIAAELLEETLYQLGNPS